MDVSVIVATFGGPEWQALAERAAASAEDQTDEVLCVHGETLASARNDGARMAGGEWLCFLDADDELEPGYFDAMSAATADLRGPAVRYVAEGRSPQTPKLWPVQDLRNGNYLVIGTLIRRDLFLDIGGFLDWPLYEDWCAWQRAWKTGATIEQVPAAVYRAHVNFRSRNRAPDRAERQRWHHEIRRHNFPELYEPSAA